ncbi:MAG: L-serine ammonia-lyase, iron-sulfur-dependent, subunit alpha [Clostridia bacterium]|nr:L-serine ammonia-lyase, iron-sulfur-dependent, subunit alpha [Clostridia bacterium]
MKSVKVIYKIGKGPSSSHTMGPQKAANILKYRYPEAELFRVILYGSLAKTGLGHGTDRVLRESFAPIPSEIEFVSEAEFELPHANTMDIVAYREGKELGRSRVMSVGGGDIVLEGERLEEGSDIYEETSFSEILAFCKKRKIRLCEYAELHEEDIYEYLSEVWSVMKASVREGLEKSGILPGGLGVERKAAKIYEASLAQTDATAENRLVCAYAFAVSEQNADNGTIVTAPTCGSCGVLPAVLKYMQDKKGYSDKDILRALATAGVVGNVVKRNASLSGAECGCQAEIGTACSMAAAALSELAGLDLDRLEYAAEIAMEHHIGLTCDPVCGLVQIPCIERNAVAAIRAINAADLAGVLGDTNKVSFDTIVKTMYETGIDLSSRYKETSEGGLAKIYGTENQ